MGREKKRKGRDSSDSDGGSDSDSESGSNSSSGSDSDAGERRHHSKDKKSSREKKKHKREKKEKSSKDEKHKKDKHKGKDKHKSKDKDKGDDMLKAAKQFLKQQLSVGGGGAPGAMMPPAAAPAPLPEEPAKFVAESQRITEDDYYTKATEFMAWLTDYRRLMFNDLTTEQQRKLFVGFVALWNAGRLPATYYAGMVAPAKRTAHVWGFAKGAGGGGGGGMAGLMDDPSSRGAADRGDRKKAAKEQRELLEEMMPRATGKEKMAEARMARREETRMRDASPDRAFLPGGGNMMGGDDSFAAAKAREANREAMQNNRRNVKREDVMARVQDAQAKEDAKMDQFRALLGQGPITIPKRS
ncbi:hypothetical protein FOA52_010099 [Chlamydomonas sp. UWO 241]|nr:hypothetical protein FOA52_010099 [Chlamydomonas sp. UWO 241]